MLTIRVETKGLTEWRAQLTGMQRQLPFATMLALNQTAQFAQGMIKAETRRVFDRPTMYAVNATYVKYATKANLQSAVWLKDRGGKVVSKASHFLYPQTLGGPRDRKAMETALLRAGVIRSNEFVVPAQGAPLDAYGNVPVGVVRKILSQLKAAEISSGYTANVTKSKRSQRSVAKAGTFFVPRPGHPGLPRGIYQRTRTGFGWATRMIYRIVVGKPRYRKRLDFFAIGRQAYEKHFAREFDTAWQRALSTAR